MASRPQLGERAAAGAQGGWRDRLRAGGWGRLAQALARHEHKTAAGLLALLVLVYLWPALVQGHVLAPIAVLFEVEPWRAHAPADAARYVNLEPAESALTYYPWNGLARQLLHAGTFPAWNPYAFAGTPLFANFQVAWLSPFSLPLWIFPLNYGLGVAAALKLWTAGFGTYLLVRELRLGFWPAMLAAVCFALCAFNIVWLSHGIHVSVAVMLPWALWLAERSVRRGNPGAGLGLAVVVAVAISGGHPGTQVHLLAGVALYTLARAALSTDVAGKERLRRLGLVGGGLALGTLLMSVVLLPAAQAAADTIGATVREDGGERTFAGSLMTFDTLRTALFPDWWGRPSEQFMIGPANYRERTFYAGSVALLLAILALVSSGGWRRKGPFAALGILGAAVAVRGPVLYDLVVGAPLFNRVQNQRILLWTLLALAVLSAFGLQALLEQPRRQRTAWGVVAAGVLAALVAVSAVPYDGSTVEQAVRYMIERSAEQQTTEAVLALASAGWWLVFVAAVAIALLVGRRLGRRGWLLGLLLVSVAAFDMLHFADGYQPMGPASTVVPPRTPAIRFLQRHAAVGRIAGYRFTLPNDWTTVYGLRDARGYDAPQPSIRFAGLWQAMEPQQLLATSFRLTEIGPLTWRVLGVLGVRYVIVNPGAGASGGDLSVAYEGDDATVIENGLAMPRAMVAERVYVAGSDEEELKAIVAAQNFDPRREAVVRSDELGDTAVPSEGAGGVAQVVEESNARVTVRAQLPRAGLVVLNDAWAPGWSVTVDGRPARALQTDVVLRGVIVPGGDHTVVWSYRVPGLRRGAVLSGFALAIAVAWGAWLIVRARRVRSSMRVTNP